MPELPQMNVWQPEIWTVLEKVVESHDTVTLKMAPKSRPSLLESPKPGQFNMIYRFGVGEIPVSFSSIQKDAVYHTVRGVGAVSRAIVESEVGDELGVRGPFGSSWESQDCEGYDIVLVVGGVGIAPIRPLIEQLIANRERYGHVMVLYGARDPQSLVFGRDTAEWSESIEFLRTVDTVGSLVDSTPWLEHVGVVPDLLTKFRFRPAKVRAFVCGPEIMMRFAVMKLIEIGLQRSQIYLSMERNMKCAVGFCGHCQFGGDFVCKDGPVFRYDKVERLLGIREV